MPFTITRPEGAQVQPQVQSSQPIQKAMQQPQGENIAATIGRNVTRSLANLAAVPGELQQAILKVGQAGLPIKEFEQKAVTPEQKQLVESLKQSQQSPITLPGKQAIEQGAESIGLPKDYLKPKNSVEEAIDMTVRNLPFIYSFGATPFLQKLAADFGSSLGMKGAEKLGLGGVGQFIGGLLGGGAVNKAIGSITKAKNPMALFEYATQKEGELAKQAEQLGQKAVIPSDSYMSKLNKLSFEVEKNKGLTPSQRQDLLQKIEQFKMDGIGGKISGTILDKSNQEINSIYGDVLKEGGQYKRMMDRLQQDIIRPAEQEIAKAHPNWYEAVQGYRDLTKAKNFGKTMAENITEYPSLLKVIKSPTTYSLLGLGAGSFGGGVLGAGLGLGAIQGAKKGLEIYPYLVQGSTTRKLLADVAKYNIEKNIPNLTKSLRLLDNEVQKMDKKVKSGEIYKGKGNFTIVRPNS